MTTQILDPRTEAERVLATFWSDRSMPVDPVTIARKLGIQVKQAELPANVSAAILKQAGSDAVIVLARGDSDKRKRFSCAHEIGHYIQRAGADELEYVDHRGPLASAGTNAEEIFANQFAANLLMPEREVREFLTQHQREQSARPPLWFLAQRFGVSAEAMNVRVETLRISLA